jgi:hypothetical protein
MYRRRRRPPQAEQFSFDSFLDVVANVVGIILRLILVAWAGARSYKGDKIELPFAPPVEEVRQLTQKAPPPDNPLAGRIREEETKLAQAKSLLTRRLEELAGTKLERTRLEGESARAKAELEKLENEKKALALAKLPEAPSEPEEPLPEPHKPSAHLAEMTDRISKAREQIEFLGKNTKPGKVHRWRTPISQTVQSEEIIFEIRENRIAAIDIGSMLDEVQESLRKAGEVLQNQWVMEGTTAPIGAFRLKYTIERERPPGLLGDAPKPDDRASFRYGLSGWEVLPLDPKRGEPIEQAMKEGSAFRRIVDNLDAKESAVTFCIYPDSFAAYRQVRDMLHERDMVVAGRPLPFEAPIAMSTKKGTVSRGQ